MRPSAYFLVFLFTLFAPVRGQYQDPGAQQDAEAAREKLLKAADELDNIQANSESTKMAVEGMKADVAKLQDTVTSLQTDNASLRQQLSDLQAAFAQEQADDKKKEKVLLDTVAAMIAAGKGIKLHVKKEPVPADSAATEVHPKPPDADSGTATTATTATTTTASLTPPPDTGSTSATAPDESGSDTGTGDAGAVKMQKGYYHVVASGETLTLISAAYRQNGVNVTVAEIQKANGLTDKSVLRIGQKLFIPKPGT